MALYLNKNVNANPLYLVDANGEPIAARADNGQPVSAAPTLVAGSDGTTVRTLSTNTVGGLFLASSSAANIAGGSASADGITASSVGIFATSRGYVFNGTTWDRQRGDLTGAWMHPPANSVSSALSGTIATSGATVTVAFVATARQEIINPSLATLWASWATPAVNGAGSFQIAPGGSFSTDRTAGTLTLLSTAATQTYTVNRYT